MKEFNFDWISSLNQPEILYEQKKSMEIFTNKMLNKSSNCLLKVSTPHARSSFAYEFWANFGENYMVLLRQFRYMQRYLVGNETSHYNEIVVKVLSARSTIS